MGMGKSARDPSLEAMFVTHSSPFAHPQSTNQGQHQPVICALKREHLTWEWLTIDPLAPVRTIRLKQLWGNGFSCPPGRHDDIMLEETGASALCMCRSISASRSSLNTKHRVTCFIVSRAPIWRVRGGGGAN